MKEMLRSALEQAEALCEQLRRARDTLGRYEGEQLTEARTEQQLDRWTRERGLGGSMDAAVTHMEKVLAELRWLQSELESSLGRPGV
jgi:hypothetical protein